MELWYFQPVTAVAFLRPEDEAECVWFLLDKSSKKSREKKHASYISERKASDSVSQEKITAYRDDDAFFFLLWLWWVKKLAPYAEFTVLLNTFYSAEQIFFSFFWGGGALK